jgi:LuxR family maltose regulon positive regulatory protein
VPEDERPESTVAPGRLLAAKLAPAPPPVPVVRRPRLVELLDAGTRGPVTLVSAAAGWGKSTLLADWHRATSATPGWVAVEAGDGGGRLWPYVWAALLPDTGPMADLAALAGLLAGRPEPAVLVLDDLHRVDDPALLDGLDFLLRHSGGRLRLVVGARTDPPLPLHRWRLRGELTEIRADRLAFTHDETGRLLAAHGVDLPDLLVDELRSRTEGWPVGLRLAALGLVDHPDPARFVGEFSGDRADVTDYLTREVLAGLPADLREALCRTAVAGYATAGLVAAVTGRADGGHLLAELDRTTGFLVPLGGRPPAYRCHRMLGDLLRARLRSWPPERLRALHARVADWACAAGRGAEALRHALTAQRWQLAVEVLLRCWPELVPYAPGAGPDDAAPPPPPDALRAEPLLALACAADRLAPAYPDELPGRLESADGPGGPVTADRVHLVHAALRLARAQVAATPHGTADAARALLALAGPDEPADPRSGGGPDAAEAARAVARTALGAARLAVGALAAAESELATAVDVAHRAGVARALLAGTGRLALVRAVRGRLVDAEARARAALALPVCRDLGAADLAPAHLALAVVAVARDRADDAAARLAPVGDPADPRTEPVVAALAGWLRADLLRDAGDLPGALAAVRAGRDRLDATGEASLPARLLLAAEADLHTAHGEVEVARELLLPALRAPGQGRAALAVALARTHLSVGDAPGTVRTLPPWDDPPARHWPLAVRLEAGLLAALAARAGGADRRAAQVLERVLDLAAPDGFRRVFRRAGAPARDLLASHLDSGTAHWALLEELVARPAPAPVTQRPAGPGPGEPLTERELTVLRYLQSILSNVEIAAEMSLSVNTVKTHVRNIYRKLDATRRREAVRRAREMRLI